MLSSDLALVFMIIVAAIVVGPILVREVKRVVSGPPLHSGLGDLGGLARTPEDRAVIEEFDRLFPSDPAAAQRVLHDHFVKQGERDEEARGALRERARTDPAAAEQLRSLLREDLEVWTTLLKDARKKVKDDRLMQVGIGNMEKWQGETRAELAAVDALIRRLHGAA